MSKFVKERDGALLSLDEARIRKYCRKYNVPVPKGEEAFWKGVHKAICQIESATDAQKFESLVWLAMHNSAPEIQAAANIPEEMEETNG